MQSLSRKGLPVSYVACTHQLYNDFLADPQNAKFESIPPAFKDLDRKSTITNKELEKAFVTLAKPIVKDMLEPGMDTVRRCGNMYSGSLYGGLASLLSNKDSKDLQGKRILMYSFGAGSAASIFVIRVAGDTGAIAQAMDLKPRLAAMQVVPCIAYVDALQTREENHNASSYIPQSSLEDLWPGTYYLKHIDEKYRRRYART